MPDQDGDKTQQATPHRRRKAREEGQVARSQDLAGAVILLGGTGALAILGASLIEYLGQVTRRQLGDNMPLVANREAVSRLWNDILDGLATHLLPILGLLFVVAVVINLLQVGFLFVPKRIAPDLTRLNPISGLKRIFSLAGVMRLLFGLFKILIIASVAFGCLYGEGEKILMMADMELPVATVYLVDLLLWTSLKIGLALLVLAILDYAFQYWKHEQDIRMTTQEVREEMKHLEGDPQVRAQRRAVQRQLALNRLESAVPKSDVVVTNPTHLAIALQYDPETMAAPVVVAKGAGVVAQRIRELALKDGIPVIEKKPLAQTLYRNVEINHPIPEDLYTAVAEVLAYVYDLQGKEIPDSVRNAA